MNYYLLKRSIDLNQIGVTDQTAYAPWYNPSLPNSIREVMVGTPIDENLRIPEFILNKNGKLTDMMRIIGLDLSIIKLISPRLLSVLEKFKLPDYQLFKTKVIDKVNEWDYYLFYLTHTFDREYVDFERSSFAQVRMSRVINSVEINSYADFNATNREAWEENNRISYVSMILKTKKIQYDFFRLYPTFYRGFIVSERLKNAIEEAGLTGMEFKPVEEIGPKD